MKADVTIQNLYWNDSLMSFFFREQAKNTLEFLLDSVDDACTAIYLIDTFCEDNGMDIDELEELFYSYSVEDVAEIFGLRLREDYAEDED